MFESFSDTELFAFQKPAGGLLLPIGALLGMFMALGRQAFANSFLFYAAIGVTLICAVACSFVFTRLSAEIQRRFALQQGAPGDGPRAARSARA